MKVKLTGTPVQSTIRLSDMTPNSFGVVTNSEIEGSKWDDWIGHIVYMGLDSHPHCMALGRWASISKIMLTKGCPLWVRTLQPGEKVEIVI